MVDISYHSMLLTTRHAYQPITFFYIEPFIRYEDDWLLYDFMDPVGTYWMSVFYDDMIWTDTPVGWLTLQEQESFYLRKHFTPLTTQWSSIALQIETNAGAEVYVNGRLVYQIGLSEGCKEDCILVNTVHAIEPQTYSFTVGDAIDKELSEDVIAIHLIPYYPVTSVFFRATVHPICSSTQLSNVHTRVTRSSPIIPVSESFSC